MTKAVGRRALVGGQKGEELIVNSGEGGVLTYLPR